MNKIVSTIIFFSLAATAQAQTAGEATIRLTGTTLMHEMRATPSPLDGAEISDRAVSFQWPLPAGLNILRSGLDGAEENTPKKETDNCPLFRIISGNPRQFNYRDESANCAYLHS